MSNIIEKKILAKYFEEIASGKKTFELRLADWECDPGDILVLVETDDETKQPTGRIMRKKVGFVGKTKELMFWPKEEVDKYGFQIISLLEEDQE